MTGLVRKATLLAACGLMIASVALASVPSKANSHIPTCIALVGNNGAGLVDAAGKFTVTVFDTNNLPVNNSLVVVDLSGCIGGDSICAAQNAGLNADNATKTVRGFSNSVGVITMSIGGHGTNTGNTAPYHAEGCVAIYADGVFLGNSNLRVYDHDGNGMGPGDLSAFLGDFFGSQPLRSDYDCTGNLGPNDLSTWLTVFFSTGVGFTGSSQNCPTTGAQYSIP